MQGMLAEMRRCFERVADPVACPGLKLSDCLMSGLAVFSLKYPSRLQFEQDARGGEVLLGGLPLDVHDLSPARNDIPTPSGSLRRVASPHPSRAAHGRPTRRTPSPLAETPDFTAFSCESRYSPTTSRSFSSKRGSVLSLNVRDRYASGRSPTTSGSRSLASRPPPAPSSGTTSVASFGQRGRRQLYRPAARRLRSASLRRPGCRPRAAPARSRHAFVGVARRPPCSTAPTDLLNWTSSAPSMPQSTLEGGAPVPRPRASSGRLRACAAYSSNWDSTAKPNKAL